MKQENENISLERVVCISYRDWKNDEKQQTNANKKVNKTKRKIDRVILMEIATT